MNLEFSRQIFEKFSSNFTKILSLGAELFQADGQTDRQTDMTKLVVFRKFARWPEKCIVSDFNTTIRQE